MSNFMSSDNATEVLGAYAGKINKIEPTPILWADYQLLSEADINSHRYIITDYPTQGAGQQLGTAAFKNAGVANGVADLDSNGKVPSSQLPSYVDDIIDGYLYNGVFYSDAEHENPITGETGKIYVDLVSDKTYRWSGSVYVEISESLALGETSSTAYAGDKGKANADNITALQSGKADKVTGATNGNLAKLDGNGNLADSGWKSDKTTTAVSGNPISITGLKSNQLAINPIITLEPIQAGSGDPSPSNVRAISGRDQIGILGCGKNLSSVKTGTNATLCKAYAEKTYTIAWDNVGSGGGFNIFGKDSGGNWIADAFTTEKHGEWCVSVCNIDTDMVLNNYGGMTPDNIRVYMSASESKPDYTPYNLNTSLTISLGQTVYGGTLDVENGVLRVDKNIVEYDGSSDENWATLSEYGNKYLAIETPLTCRKQQTVIANMFKGTYSHRSLLNNGECSVGTDYVWLYIRYDEQPSLSDWKTYLASNPLQVVYELATPYTIQLTPHEISLLKDVANVSIADAGASMSFSYHNGEVASLGDVEALGQTVNNLGEYVNNDSRYNEITVATNETWKSALNRLFNNDFFKIGNITKLLFVRIYSDGTSKEIFMPISVYNGGAIFTLCTTDATHIYINRIVINATNSQYLENLDGLVTDKSNSSCGFAKLRVYY